jgi:hypothetical protein
VWLKQMSAGSEGWLVAPEEIHIPARPVPALVTHVGVMILLEASSRSLCCLSAAVTTPEGNLRSSGSGNEGACLRLSPPWGHFLGVDFAWGPVKEGLWPRLLARGAVGSLATMMQLVEFGSRLGLG